VSAVLNWILGGEGGAEKGDGDHSQDTAGTETPPTPPDQEFAMDRGTAVHRFFELWDFGGDNADLPDRVLDESDFEPQQREALRAQLARMAERFCEDPLHARLAADAAFRRELPFLLPFEGHLILGTIDALLGDGTVLDYKTGAPNAEKLERYSLQLALYAEAVRQVTGDAPEEGLLYFVDRALVERVPLGPGPIAAAMERVRRVLRERGGGRT
jgi:ATP-dependent exoDNAse (exonuclease V) beta subunit